MNSVPIFSVMIPTWNPNPDYLKQALDSVLIQDMGPDKMQIAVVDDCSKAFETETWLQENGYLPRVELYQNEKNLGIGAAWNQCIEHSRGEYVHILHQDDVLEDGFYAENFKIIRETEKSFGLIINRNGYLNNVGLVKTFSVLIESKVLFDTQFYKKMHNIDVQCPGVIVPKVVYNELGIFRTDLHYALDREMWYRISTKYPVLYNPAPKCYFRVHESSQSSRLGKNYSSLIENANSIELICSHLPHSDRYPIEKELKKRITRQLLKLSKNEKGGIKKKLRTIAWENGDRKQFIKSFLF